MSDRAFYVTDGDALVPTELTRGPWDPGAQHAGPPAALLGRAIERCAPRDDVQVGRITVEILGPVPLAPLTTSAVMVRPGRGVEMLEASLAGPDGDVMRARAWRLRLSDQVLDPPPPADPPPADPDAPAPGD